MASPSVNYHPYDMSRIDNKKTKKQVSVRVWLEAFDWNFNK